jgi:hypothetical protein
MELGERDPVDHRTAHDRTSVLVRTTVRYGLEDCQVAVKFGQRF